MELAHDVGAHDPVPTRVLRLDRRQGYVEQDGHGRALPASGAGQQPSTDGGAEVSGVDDRGQTTGQALKDAFSDRAGQVAEAGACDSQR